MVQTAPRRVTIIALTELIEDFSLYPRAQVDDYHVREIAAAMEAGVEMPPVIADVDSKRIIDGFHRCRAAKRKNGPLGRIKVLLKKYSSEASMFEEAARLNSDHGRNLTVYDKTRVLVRGRELGLSIDNLADALHITRDRADNLVLTRVSATGQVLKRTMAHFAGAPLSDTQGTFNRGKAGGMDQLFYINQVKAILETDSVDWSRQNVIDGLSELHSLLFKHSARFK